MKFKKSHILLISLISLFLLLSMSAVSAASDDASIAQATEINDIDAIDDMGNDILSGDGDGTEGGDPTLDDPETGETTDPLPVSTTTIESRNKTYINGDVSADFDTKNVTIPIVIVKDGTAIEFYRENITLVMVYNNGTDYEAVEITDFDFSVEEGNYTISFVKDVPFNDAQVKYYLCKWNFK